MQRKNYLVFIYWLCLVGGCSKDPVKEPSNPPPDIHNILLKDIVYDHLPSPYYHFEYNGEGKIIKASYQSNLAMYNLVYTEGNITEVKNNTLVNKDRLVYSYQNDLVSQVNYFHEDGTNFKKCFVTYNTAKQLQNLLWQRLSDGGFFVTERSADFQYRTDSNLSQLQNHLMPIPGVQNEALYIDTYEDYDNTKNVDGFSLFHLDSDHPLLLPDAVLQKNNPHKLTRTGDGVHYTITYDFAFTDELLPTKRMGKAVITNGPSAGDHFDANTTFSYY
ncbi:MAG: hypothetical protein ABI921_09415 [Panacibacter sp.]